MGRGVNGEAEGEAMDDDDPVDLWVYGWLANAIAGNAANSKGPIDFAAPDDPEVGPGQYRCAMCGEVFECGWTDDEARDEAAVKGVDPASAGLVCDDCYKLTPWGADPERG